MKFIAWYVERCKVVKGFKFRAAGFVSIIGTLIGTFLNLSVGYEFKRALIMGIILGVFVFFMWLLFLRAIIKFSEKQKLRKDEEERKIKEEKRNRAKERSENKNKNKRKK